MVDQTNVLRAKRHRELWEVSSRNLGRLIVGTLIFGTVVLFKVLVPYTDNLDHLALVREGEVDAHRKLEFLDARLTQATEATKTVAEVIRTIDAKPWQDEREALQISIKDLVGQANTLRAVEPQNVTAALHSVPDLRVFGDSQRDTQQLPPAERSTNLRRTPVSTRILGRLRQMSLPAIKELHGLESSVVESVLATRQGRIRPDARALRGQGLSDEVLSHLASLPPAEIRELRGTPLLHLQEKKIQIDQPIREAADSLSIDPEILKQLRGNEGWKDFVDASLREAASTQARISVKKMVAVTQNSIIAPLQSILRKELAEYPSASELEHNINELEGALSNWDSRYANRNDWYETVDGKAIAFETLGDDLRTYRESCQTVANDILDGLNTQKNSFDTQHEQAHAEISNIQNRLVEIGESLQSALPSWLRGFITIDYAIQFFSFAVLFLLVLGGWYSARTRSHFLVVREQLRAVGVDDTEPAMSTIWTLVYRRPLGTIVTIAAYAIAVGAAWYFIARGAHQVRRWRTHDPDIVIGLAADGTLLLAWLAPFLCIAAFAITLGTLVKDYRICRQTVRTTPIQP